MNFTDSTLKSTLFTNYGFHSITAFIQILTIPIYIKFVGISEWAYIAYLLLAQSLLTMIDSGLIIGLQRIFSKLIKNNHGIYDALKTFEILMFLMLIIIIVVLSVFILCLHYFGFFNTDIKSITSIFGGALIYMSLAQSLPHKALLLTNNKQILNNGLTLIMLISRHSLALILLSHFQNILSFIIAHLFLE